jgi:cobalt-zinc-cadmium efflux system membrane fusion protein
MMSGAWIYKSGRLALVALCALGLFGCGSGAPPKADAQEAKQGDEYEKGPHRGRMLRSGAFAIEVTIFEDGVDPEFRVYAYQNDKPVPPGDVALEMKLSRLGAKIDSFAFKPEGDALRGDGTVKEPHSFDVEVGARFKGEQYRWTYASYEGRTTISAEAAKNAGMEIEAAGPAVLDEKVDLAGRVIMQPRGRAEVRAWYPGRIVEMTKNIGDGVQQGEALLRVEASDSLRTYTIPSPISGIVMERQANVGDVASQQTIYVIVDPTKLQASLYAFPRDAGRVRVGQPVVIDGLDGRKLDTKVSRILPNADPSTQSTSILADLDNADGTWRAGLAVEGAVTVQQIPVSLAVRTQALQRFRDFTVVFAKVGDTYEVRMLKLGRQTTEWTEVLGGLDPGEQYVSSGSFLIRADIEKSGASHDH